MATYIPDNDNSLICALCEEYPEISGPLIASTTARATADLGPELSSDRLAALSRHRLDAIRDRLIAASRRCTRQDH